MAAQIQRQKEGEGKKDWGSVECELGMPLRFNTGGVRVS